MESKQIFNPCGDWLMKSVPVLSPYGRRELKKLLTEPWPEVEKLEREFAELDQVVAACNKNPDLFSGFAEIFAVLRDISGTFANLDESQVLDEIELFEVKTLLLELSKIRQRYLHSPLRLDSVGFCDLQPMLKLLNPEEVVTSSFYLYEAYSPALAQIRKDKTQLEKLIVAAASGGEKESLRRQRSELVAAEKEVEFELRRDLSRKLQAWLKPLLENVAAVARLELLLARAVLARRWPSCCPQILKKAQDVCIQIEEAINPEVAEILEAEGKEFCPVSIELQPGATILTGANMGGKTVAMQTFAFNVQLARLGFYPFARYLRMPALDFVCFVGGDSQNQQAGLSSFGAEIINLGQVAGLIKNSVGLALFDEFARSTNPCEGGRFVRALCEFLQQNQSFGLVATHYDGVAVPGAECFQVVGLKNLPQDAPGLNDAKAVLDRLCANMDYRLQKVVGQYQVPQDALHIAHLLGADRDFLAILKKLYD